MKQAKTNAMRLLDSKKISYELMTYDSNDGKIDGVSVAEKLGRDTKFVYKTLVTQGVSKQLYVCIIPVEKELNLKKAAQLADEKKLEMIAVKDIQKWTGYIRGGCSPVGMKKLYPTMIDESASYLENIVVSGGKIGVQMGLKVEDLVTVTAAKLGGITD
ncbi:Cys-tRNA(Pro) deacylase [Bacillus suaedaesalsae]|uniref:Cys-tRNA(Pro)/Cys-tRNA(Cys) deacylase n=1 Tax=Bacillus suaedaesalsae TaxID=2810349 RepID=A0ABS2DJX6_9BACI|nr:Cys-tRNA(Pro) deacylase [Bacillus suaedaesalsae]MBM6618773.1 Cys-tRNA(Pro) deacylase [Bacillus suaedaesalsae]